MIDDKMYEASQEGKADDQETVELNNGFVNSDVQVKVNL